jgi:hypothetical protein
MDDLTSIKSEEATPVPNMSSEELLKDMPLKKFNKDEEIEDIQAEEKLKEERQKREMKIRDKENVTPLRKWKAI